MGSWLCPPHGVRSRIFSSRHCRIIVSSSPARRRNGSAFPHTDTICTYSIYIPAHHAPPAEPSEKLKSVALSMHIYVCFPQAVPPPPGGRGRHYDSVHEIHPQHVCRYVMSPACECMYLCVFVRRNRNRRSLRIRQSTQEAHQCSLARETILSLSLFARESPDVISRETKRKKRRKSPGLAKTIPPPPPASCQRIHT